MESRRIEEVKENFLLVFLLVCLFLRWQQGVWLQLLPAVFPQAAEVLMASGSSSQQVSLPLSGRQLLPAAATSSHQSLNLRPCRTSSKFLSLFLVYLSLPQEAALCCCYLCAHLRVFYPFKLLTTLYLIKNTLC